MAVVHWQAHTESRLSDSEDTNGSHRLPSCEDIAEKSPGAITPYIFIYLIYLVYLITDKGATKNQE